MQHISEKAKEFADNVWNHASDEFQASFDDRRSLTEDELLFLSATKDALESPKPLNHLLVDLRKKFIETDGKLLELMLQLCGLTRNKVLQDLKGTVGSNRAGMSFTNYKSLYSNDMTWQLAGPYLIKKISKVFLAGNKLKVDLQKFEALNQATWAGYIRQERAKRSGHEAESRMANLLLELGIPFSPKEKADNPMCRDIQINDVSFDIVVPDAAAPRVCVKSTVHTANIGQYGESKDHLEMDEARRMIDTMPENKRPLLIAFIDGVGFESNRAGLHGVLEKSDYFVQFKTIWKLVIISAAALGKICEIDLPSDVKSKHEKFLSEFSKSIVFKSLALDVNSKQAGEAQVKIAT